MPVALFSTAVLSTALGTWVLFDRPSKALNKTFFLLCLTIGGWATLIGFSQISFINGTVRGPESIGLGYLFGSIAPLLFYLTCRSFHGYASTSDRANTLAATWCALCVYLGFDGSIVRELKITEGRNYYEFVTEWGFFVFLSYVVFIGGLSARELLLKYKTTRLADERLQLIYFGIGSGLSFTVALVCNVILPTIGYSTLSPYGATSPLIALGILSLAITRHHLMGVRVSFKWSATVCIWILVLWVPLTLYLFLSSQLADSQNLVLKLLLYFGFTLWLIALYCLSVANEKKLYLDSARSLSPQLTQAEPAELFLRDDLRLLGDLIDAVMHDLKSNLTLAVLEAKRQKPVNSKLLLHTYRETLCQLKGVREVISAERSIASLSRCDLLEVIRTILDSKEDQIKAKAISIQLDALPAVKSDRVILHYVFSNVIDNAIKYVGDKSHSNIRIYSKTFSSYVYIYVRDNGLGMNRRELSRAFEPFYRGTKQRLGETVIEGTGLGLTIVQRLLSRVDGKILITSQENLGTTVSIRLPRA